MIPKVSVIITSIGRPELGLAINSVKKQTYENIEIIVVLDGVLPSGIDTQDVKIIYLNQVKNGNIARNIGIKAATGEFIALLDDDDTFYPKKIQKQIEQITKKEDVLKIVSYTKVKLYNPENNVSKILPSSQIKKNEAILDYLFRRINPGFIQTSTLFAHRSIFLNNPFNEVIQKHQDWDWLVNGQKKMNLQFIMLDDVLVEYRVNSLGTSVGTKNKWRYSLTWFSNYESETSKYTKASFYTMIIGSIMKDRKLDLSDRVQESFKVLNYIPFCYFGLRIKSYLKILLYSIKNI